MSVHEGEVPPEVDYLIVGTGFGGSVMAARLSEAGRQVCVLERGKAYPPGAFPRTPDGLARNVWDPAAGLRGMFDLWSFNGIDAIVASGLGGGSLIYANVMLRMHPDSFRQPQPNNEELTENWSFDYDDLRPHYEAVEDFLDVQKLPVDTPGFTLAKTTEFMAGAEGKATYANLAVQFKGPDGHPVVGGQVPATSYPNLFGVPRRTCRLTGECDIGCNDGAKNSLDHTYLSAASCCGATIHTMTEARLIRRIDDPDGFRFEVAYTVRRRDPSGDATGTVKAKRLILAAGSLGTTYLLLRSSHAGGLELPPWAPLGERFCGNGDLLGFILPKDDDRDFEPTRGPVITAYRHLKYQMPDTGTDTEMFLEDGGFPAFVAWLTTMADPGYLMDRLGDIGLEYLWDRWRDDDHSTNVSQLVSGLLRGSAVARSLPLLAMGRDIADGRLYLDDDMLRSTWNIRRSRAYFDQVDTQMKAMAARLGGRLLGLPGWLRRIITVHPLGGCPADTSHFPGVVDKFGRVHGIPGLRICDGSVFPGPAGANPSLTIAAFADWSATQLLDDATEAV